MLEESKSSVKQGTQTLARKVIVIKGSRAQIDEAKKELNKLFANEDNHQCKHEINKPIPGNSFTEIAAICKKNFGVTVKQFPQQFLTELTIKGLKCKETKRWLIEKLPELSKLNFPPQWQNPVS